jgi:hypothetical protein
MSIWSVWAVAIHAFPPTAEILRSPAEGLPQNDREVDRDCQGPLRMTGGLKGTLRQAQGEHDMDVSLFLIFGLPF